MKQHSLKFPFYLRFMKYVFSLVLLAITTQLSAQRLENITFVNQGKTIVITYDLEGCTADETYAVQVKFKEQGGGEVIPTSLSGDIKQVSCGSKRIVWDVFKDRSAMEGKYYLELTAIVSTMSKDIGAGYISHRFVLEKEVWKVGYNDASVEVFNRWGEIVFKAESYMNDWNGVSIRYGIVPSGTYLYFLDPKDGTEIKKGYVELIQTYSDGNVDGNKSFSETKGFRGYEGGPDSDYDGLLDNNDKCPYQAGPIQNQGCPYQDTDKDGLLDSDDACPNTPGPLDNKGCPSN